MSDEIIEALLIYCRKLRLQIEELKYENEMLNKEIARIRRNEIHKMKEGWCKE